MDNNNQNGGVNQGYYDPQNQPYGQNQQFQQNVPYEQNQPFQQNAPYGQNQPFQQNQPYGQNQQFQQNMPYGQAPMGAPKKKKTGLVVGIIIGILLLIGVGVFVTLKLLADKDQDASKEVVEAFFDGYEKQSLDDMYDCFHPDIRELAKTYAMANLGNGESAQNEDDYWQFFNDYFGGFSIDYEIKEQKKISGDELEDELDTVKTYFDVDISCKKAYAFKLRETYSGANGSQEQEETVIVGKADGKWYIIMAATDRIISNDVTTTTEEVTTEEETTEETTEEVTTEEVTTTEAASGSGTVAGAGEFDWDRMQFTFEGTSYELGSMTYQDIEAMGFAIDDSYLTEQLEDNQYSLSISAEAADGSDMYVRFKNFTGGGTKDVRDCEILGITLSRDEYSNFYEASLGNGITFGMTMDEVKAIMGEPSYEYISEDSDYSSIDYEADDQAYANEVSFTFGPNGLKEIDLINYN